MSITTTQGFRGKLVDKASGRLLDMFSDETIKVSNNILQLFDIGELPGTFTTTITLPGTKFNNEYFEHYYDISIQNPDIFNTNQKVEAYLDFDGYFLVDGYIQLNRVNVYQNKFVDSYEITLFGVISNFSVDSRNTYLTDLSGLSRYNHSSSYNNIVDSWNGNLFDGDIVYPLAEYGQRMRYTNNNDWNGIDDYEGALTVQDFKPAIRVKRVWDEVFYHLGYRYTGSFWQQEWLDDVYMILNRDKRTVEYPDVDLERYGMARGKVTSKSGNLLYNIVLGAGIPKTIPIDTVEWDYSNVLSYSPSYVNSYTVDKFTTLNCTLDLSYEITSTGAGSGQPQWYVHLYSGSVAVSTTTLADLNSYLITKLNSVGQTVSETQAYSVNFVTSPLPPGDYSLRVEFIKVGSANFTIALNPGGQLATAFSVDKVRQAADGLVVDIPLNMPYGNAGITLLDWIKGIQKKFNLIIYPDKSNPKSFIVETFNNWYSEGDIVDFNRYINIDDKISVTPANSLAYKKLKFKDNTDGDYVTTLFQRENSRTYGESVFVDSGSFFSGGELTVDTVFGNGPLLKVSGSGVSGSLKGVSGCTNYIITNNNTSASAIVRYFECSSGSAQFITVAPSTSDTACSVLFPRIVSGSNVRMTANGLCDFDPYTSVLPMYVPTYISDDKWNPTTVNPRLFFYNGKLPASEWWLQYDTGGGFIVADNLFEYPYFDHYSGSYPTTGSLSLLFNNEQPPVGNMPTHSLVTKYWDKWLGLLYNPRTRLTECSAIIPIGDYIDIELNDIAQFRGNYYHIRAINDYDLTTGECNVQLLGPIISDTISSILNRGYVPPPPADSCTAYGQFIIFPDYSSTSVRQQFTIPSGFATVARPSGGYDDGTGIAYASIKNDTLGTTVFSFTSSNGVWNTGSFTLSGSDLYAYEIPLPAYKPLNIKVYSDYCIPAPPPPPTGSGTPYLLGYSAVGCSGACTAPQTTYYTSGGAALQWGTTLYTDSFLTTTASNGYYGGYTLCFGILSGNGLINQVQNCIVTSQITLSPNYSYDFNSITGTGLPSFALPSTGNNVISNYTGSIPAQTIIVNISGTTSIIPGLAVSLAVNGIEQDYKCITTMSATNYSLNMPTITAPDTMRISIISGKGGC